MIFKYWMSLNSSPMLPNYNTLFPEFSDNCRIWIYTSNRLLTNEECQTVSTMLSEFVANWATHGKGMRAASAVIDSRFLVIVSDEEVTSASGCSIDSSVRLVKSIGSQFNIDFFNRLKVVVLNEGEQSFVSIHSLSTYPNALVYNPLIQSLGELRNTWLEHVSESVLLSV
jgi:hypothetical protein